MSKWQKLIEKILAGRLISYEEAEAVLLKLGFKVEITGSHHVFRKNGYSKNVSIKRRPQLLPYQLRDLKEVLIDHDY
ncbi:MAG: type II toxin-antitoxin system HicA family toxin [Chlamydiales bacterium]|nr:type II toxin-antitoxin system HicA family toxin [Chlamydiales bacterium]